MKLSKKHQSVEKTNSSACKVTEHPLINGMFNVAVATISGRYPEERRVINHECAELGYVLEGQGKIVINDEVHLLNTGDVVMIEPGEKYYWEGNMQLFLSCRPAWTKEQHQIVD
ncbi:MAG TPA: cupin domain-containing protein [Gammaproteobacteria bacterium]|nr:cupin domain-containing protein [Gammaproteobacteria bacterium]